MNNEILMTEEIDRLNLSTIQKIKSLSAIPGKDRVEVVAFENCGYTAICEKMHQVGDLIVFTKYDSVVADIPPFEWMKDMKFRVKQKAFTIKDDDGDMIGKIYSQGIVITLNAMEEWMYSEDYNCNDWEEFKDGDDVTAILETKKYIPKLMCSSGSQFGTMRSKGSFPIHLINKTDEVNGCSKIHILDEIKDKKVYISVKDEGSSFTCLYHENGEFLVCSRKNMIEEEESNAFWYAANKYNLKTKLMNYKDYAIQAELVSNKIQKNKLKLTEPDIHIFNIIDLKSRKRVGYQKMVEICSNLEIPMVDIIEVIDSFDYTLQDIYKIITPMTYKGTDNLIEGCVIRTLEFEYSNILKSDTSFKIINPEYSL